MNTAPTQNILNIRQRYKQPENLLQPGQSGHTIKEESVKQTNL